MTDPTDTILAYLRKVGASLDQDFLREAVRVMSALLMEIEVKAPGLTGIDKSAVSRVSQQLDEVVRQFREQKLEGAYPYLWLDALYLKVRQNHRIVS
jgi:transposase-like protein